MTWLTPRRMRAATAILFVLAAGVSSLGLSGSTPAPAHRTPPPALAAQQH